MRKGFQFRSSATRSLRARSIRRNADRNAQRVRYPNRLRTSLSQVVGQVLPDRRKACYATDMTRTVPFPVCLISFGLLGSVACSGGDTGETPPPPPDACGECAE